MTKTTTNAFIIETPDNSCTEGWSPEPEGGCSCLGEALRIAKVLRDDLGYQEIRIADVDGNIVVDSDELCA